MCAQAVLAAVTWLASSLVAASPYEQCEASTSKFLKVETTNGLIEGHIVDDTPCVIEYLGIPYAKPPVGDLRFASPQRYEDHHSYEAKDFGYDCPHSTFPYIDYPDFFEDANRIIDYFAASGGTPQSEDCLTLNIWAKATFRSNLARKPVLVFFYGGKFTFGNTNTPFYYGVNFANAEDLVVVTVNYRMNIFGFPGADGLDTNLGMRDQRLATEWVRDNIAAFGGDTSKITISGQSAGGATVDYWTYAYRDDPIISAAITHSGNVFSFPLPDPSTQQDNWETVVDYVGCGNATDTFKCMRNASWEDIKAGAATVKSGQSSSPLRTVPSFYPKADNLLVFTDYLERTDQGDFAKVPILYGNNNNEAGFYAITVYSNGAVPTQEQDNVFNLESFTCAVAKQVESRRRHGTPAWAFRYMGDWNNTRLYPTSGAYHGTDMHMLFGNSAAVSGLPTSEPQRGLTKLMQHSWFAFLDNPRTGLSERGWPEYDPNEKTLVRLGNDNKPEYELLYPSSYDSFCSNTTLGSLGTSTTTSSVKVRLEAEAHKN
ncbi:carboxylesterase, putative [Talaromyces stipitatus ATCC 10500]|uniref:Carboxylic ester hydrolase n=1 Tax=Talaromyces stipitatus (strain ATCC 10500 / CBS 375.48 / QM 6759 / NRRL 1006) TaxID=441959 RepID=B8MBG5_TALSN|nr:carboxylesterase, putative [Talaromyces stipitatus ATCC 10500]EED17829.1 carboxylesterase, putative [Talaromyces stipitatus ATCC 10500]